MRRLLTMANLFENLSGIYGGLEALALDKPLGYRALSSRSLTFRDCLHFTNLAAEAFIGDLDLKKGERVVLCIPEPADSLLVSAALMKAGGIVVPLDHGLPAGEIAHRVQGCGATLAVVDGKVLAERADLADSMPGLERMMVSGPRLQAPDGILSLDKAMDLSSGFFLPYTLKPSNVVGLFYTGMQDGSLKAVMATNEGLLGPQRWATLLFPTRPGDLCVCAASLRSMAGFSAAVLGLCMGLRLHLLPHLEPESILEVMEAEKPAAFLGTPEIFASLLKAGASGRDLSTVRFWFSAGGDLPPQVVEWFQAFSSPRLGVLRRPACFVETYGAGGNATALTFKPASPFLAWPAGCPGLVIPPNRLAVVDEAGRPLGRGKEGELVIKGPAVTPGYWNDVEGTLAAKRDGWLYTGIKAVKGRLLGSCLRSSIE